MCGIAGIISKSGREIKDANARIALMSKILFHRGPDYSGLFISADRCVAMANTRLAIVDSATNFSIPLEIDAGNHVISFNGELYNYQHLQKYLQTHGCYFHTNADTEVLLRGLALEGIDFLARVTGFWSFAYYNALQSEVYLCRDVMGEKHLFYYESDDEVIFSSEINPILAVIDKAVEYCPEAIVSSFIYRSAPVGGSLIAGIKRMQPGQCFKLRPGKSNQQYFYTNLDPSYWRNELQAVKDENLLLEILDHALYSACRARIPNEVKFVCTLSGGLDSALINYYINQHLGAGHCTLYGKSTRIAPGADNELNEQMASRYIAAKLKTNHHELNMLSDSAVAHYRVHASNSFDGVFCEGVPAFSQIAAEARRLGAKVLILSDGPDELLNGYPVDVQVLTALSSNIGKSTFHNLILYLRLFQLSRKYNQISSRALENLTRYQRDPFKFVPLHCGTGARELKQFFRKEYLSHGMESGFGTISPRYEHISDVMDNSQKMAMSYCTHSLPDYFNLRTDRGVSLNSVESRLPFQDKNLVELLLAIDEKWKKIESGTTKHLLRKLVKNKIGEKISSRNKYGFAIPIWHEEKYRKKLGLVEVIQQSSILNQAPFNKKAKQFILQDNNKRLQWFAYCLAMSHEKLSCKNYEVDNVPLGVNQ